MHGFLLIQVHSNCTHDQEHKWLVVAMMTATQTSLCLHHTCMLVAKEQSIVNTLHQHEGELRANGSCVLTTLDHGIKLQIQHST